MNESSHPPNKSLPPNCIGHLVAGLMDANVSLVTNHPGFRSNELASVFHGDGSVTSANERIAYAIAWGHAIGGRRAAVALKNVGLNDAADAFLNSLVLDVRAGFVVLVFDDTDVEHSQLRLDSRHYQAFLGGAWLEPRSLEEAREFARMAFEWSEQVRMPVVVRITNALLSRGSSSQPLPLPVVSGGIHGFLRSPQDYVVHPSNHLHQTVRLREKHRLIEAWAEAVCQQANPGGALSCDEVHIIVGAARLPAGIDHHAALRIPCLPVPEPWLRRMIPAGARIHVHEHGDKVVTRSVSEAWCAADVTCHGSGSISPNRNYHSYDHLEPVYRQLRRLPNSILVGDLGQHTMDAERSLDACLCYGASVATAIGIALACPEATVSCVCGDGAFLHSAAQAVPEAVARCCRLLILVLDNGGCLGTGGQMPPGDTWTGMDEVIEQRAAYSRHSPAVCLAAIEALAPLPGVKILHLEMPYS